MIEYIFDENTNLYTIVYNGEIVLECLSEKEVNALTIGEVKKLAKMQ